MPVHLTCLHCGQSFSRKPAKAATAKYCSRTCADNAGSVTRTCGACEQPLHIKLSVALRYPVSYCGNACRWIGSQVSLTHLYRRHAVIQGGCWGWIGSQSKGYGYFSTRRNGALKRHWAHRFSWTIHRGAIPDGMSVLHLCDNPPCTNPDHLFLGTQADNMHDMARKGRARSQRSTHRSSPADLAG